MFEHVLNVATGVIEAANTIIVSAVQTALELARECGAIAVRGETRARLNPALNLGAKTAAAMGGDAVLILPTDLPTIPPR